MTRQSMICGGLLVLVVCGADLAAAEREARQRSQAARPGAAKAVAPKERSAPKPSPRKAAADTRDRAAPALLNGNETEVELLSDNTPKLLSENRAELLSGNSPELLSRNRAHLFSDNLARFISKVRVLSGNTFHVNITIENSGNRPAGSESDTLFGSLDRDGDGRLSPEEFRETLRPSAPPASF